MPPQRLKANAPSHTFDRNLVFDAFIFILTSPTEISLFENVGLREACGTYSGASSDRGRLLKSKTSVSLIVAWGAKKTGGGAGAWVFALKRRSSARPQVMSSPTGVCGGGG